jgi:hypothetical protein
VPGKRLMRIRVHHLGPGAHRPLALMVLAWVVLSADALMIGLRVDGAPLTGPERAIGR